MQNNLKRSSACSNLQRHISRLRQRLHPIVHLRHGFPFHPARLLPPSLAVFSNLSVLLLCWTFTATGVGFISFNRFLKEADETKVEMCQMALKLRQRTSLELSILSPGKECKQSKEICKQRNKRQWCDIMDLLLSYLILCALRSHVLMAPSVLFTTSADDSSRGQKSGWVTRYLTLSRLKLKPSPSLDLPQALNAPASRCCPSSLWQPSCLHVKSNVLQNVQTKLSNWTNYDINSSYELPHRRQRSAWAECRGAARKPAFGKLKSQEGSKQYTRLEA